MVSRVSLTNIFQPPKIHFSLPLEKMKIQSSFVLDCETTKKFAGTHIHFHTRSVRIDNSRGHIFLIKENKELEVGYHQCEPPLSLLAILPLHSFVVRFWKTYFNQLIELHGSGFGFVIKFLNFAVFCITKPNNYIIFTQ